MSSAEPLRSDCKDDRQLGAKSAIYHATPSDGGACGPPPLLKLRLLAHFNRFRSAL